MRQLDMKLPFLNGPVEREVYVKQSLDFKIKGQEKMVYIQIKVLYGSKLAPRACSKRIDNFLIKLGYKK